MNADVSQEPIQTDDIQITEILSKLWSHKWVIIFCVSIGITVGFFLVFTTERVYSGSATFEVESAGPLSISAGPASITLTNSAVQKTLTSNQFMVRILDKISAPIIIKSKRFYFPEPLYTLFGTIGLPLPRYTEAVPIVEQFDVPESMLGTEFQFKVEDGRYSLQDEDQNIIFEGLLGRGTFSRKSDLLEIRLSFSEDIEEDLAEFTIVPYSESGFATFIREHMEVTKDKFSGEVPVTIEYHDRQFIERILTTMVEVYLTDVEKMARGPISQAVKILEDQNLKTETELDEANEMLAAFTEKHGNMVLAQEAAMQMQKLNAYKEQLISIQEREKKLHYTHTAEHPQVLELKEQAKRLTIQIVELDNRLSNLPEIQFELQTLQASVEALTIALSTGEAKLIETMVMLETVSLPVKLIKPPFLNPEPISPNVTSLVVSNFIVGFIIGFGLVIVRTSFEKVSSQEELRNMMSLPIMGEVPHSKLASKNLVCSLRDDRLSPNVLESFATMAMSSEYMVKGGKNNIVLFSSFSPQQGKSFVSMNFAVASSKHMKVLLIDANLITPTLHDPMGYNPIPGLSDLIIGKNTIEEVIVSVKDGSLAFLPAGTYPANENLLLQNPRFYDLMDQLGEQFDMVLLDYPTLDMNQMGIEKRLNFAGNLIIVSRYNSNLAELRKSVRNSMSKDIYISSLLLNDFPLSRFHAPEGALNPRRSFKEVFQRFSAQAFKNQEWLPAWMRAEEELIQDEFDFYYNTNLDQKVSSTGKQAFNHTPSYQMELRILPTLSDWTEGIVMRYGCFLQPGSVAFDPYIRTLHLMEQNSDELDASSREEASVSKAVIEDRFETDEFFEHKSALEQAQSSESSGSRFVPLEPLELFLGHEITDEQVQFVALARRPRERHLIEGPPELILGTALGQESGFDFHAGSL